jgi:L,D-peptidoglycan transpeptidase YkuD (ErfK/YbiS/YcfS/YnhG family)
MTDIIVEKDGVYPAAKVYFEQNTFDSVIGKEGITSNETKKEGDSKTPVGEFRILGLYYRPDKMAKPKSGLPTYEIVPDDIWVDESGSPLYNQPAKKTDISEGVSHEDLYRPDHLYDIFLDLDYNRSPAIPGKGSAIFLHVARDKKAPKNTPTAGCIALKKEDLLIIVENLTLESKVIIKN